jgi:thermitase
MICRRICLVMVLSLCSSRASFVTRTSLFLGGQEHGISYNSLSLQRSENLLLQFHNGAQAEATPDVMVGLDSSLDTTNEILSPFKIRKVWGELGVVVFQTKSAIEAIRISRSLKNQPGVRYAHPDLIYSVESRAAAVDSSAVSDPLYASQWNLHGRSSLISESDANIHVEEAWKVTRGSSDTVIALLDLGFEATHEDLQEAWFVNGREVPGNKIDDDHNGLIDDVSGWNFSIHGPNLIYGQNSKHGTASAGIIGARQNGKGVVGVCPECKILPIVVSGRSSEDAAAILYAHSMNASILSNSWGYALDPPVTDVVSDALQYVSKSGRSGLGTPIIFAMHNAGVDDCKSSSPDISAHPSVIAVSSSDHQDVKVASAGYGSCLAFLAPSSGSPKSGIPTTDRMGANGYNNGDSNNFADLSYHNGFWGTSAAAPQVAGVFGLLLSRFPELTLPEAFDQVKRSAIRIRPEVANYDSVSGHSKTYGYGRIDCRALLQ